jgi:hypothetical protein
MILILTEVWCGFFQGELIFLFIISISLHNLRTVSGLFFYSYKRQGIPKGKSKMDNPGKLAYDGTQDEEKQKHNTICVRHYYTQTNTNNVNKT